MELNSFFENYIFKKRYIYIYDLVFFKEDTSVSFFPMTDEKAIEIINNADDRLAVFLKNRLNNPAWIFFYHHEGEEILGYSFLHVPEQPEWNDSLPTMPGEARVGSNYVYPKYRGRGIIGSICRQEINFSRINNLKLWSVIEKSNTASLRAEGKYCTAKKNNYLIKIYARNIISIVTNPLRLYLLLGKRRERR